jgi:hypothetical protein
MYARVLRRYHELLDRVARGELQPEEIQKQFRDYLQEQAATSTRELVELSVGLLAGLLYVEAKYREELLDGLLPSDAPLPPPPSPSGIDLTNWFQTLAKYATEQSARGMSRHQMLVERVAAGEIPPSRVQDQGRRFLEEHAPKFLGEVMNLGLTFVGRLQRSSTNFAEGVYDRVLGPDTERSSPPEPPVCVDLRGLAGSVSSADIVVENTRSDTAEVVCRGSEFAPRTGGRRFRSGLEVVPARFTLAPGEQRDVNLRLPLDPSLFAPGADYVATLQISGAGEHQMIVQLMARAERPERKWEEHRAGSASTASAFDTFTDKPQADVETVAAEKPVATRGRSESSRPRRRHR